MLKISYKLKVNEFDDSTNTKRGITKGLSSLRSNDDANVIVRGVRMFNSTTPQFYHQQPCPRAQSYTPAPTTHTRAGALTFPLSCLDGGVPRVGPGQYPQYTRAPFGEEPVGSSQNRHHRAPQMSPRQHPTRGESLAQFRNISRDCDIRGSCQTFLFLEVSMLTTRT